MRKAAGDLSCFLHLSPLNAASDAVQAGQAQRRETFRGRAELEAEGAHGC